MKFTEAPAAVLSAVRLWNVSRPPADLLSPTYPPPAPGSLQPFRRCEFDCSGKLVPTRIVQCLSTLHLVRAFGVRPHHSVCQHALPLHSQRRFSGTSHLSPTHSPGDGAHRLGLLLPLGSCESPAVNKGAQMFGVPGFRPLGHIPRRESAGSHSNSLCNFPRNHHAGFHEGYTPNDTENFHFLHILANTYFLYDSHLTGCEARAKGV